MRVGKKLFICLKRGIPGLITFRNFHWPSSDLIEWNLNFLGFFENLSFFHGFWKFWLELRVGQNFEFLQNIRLFIFWNAILYSGNGSNSMRHLTSKWAPHWFVAFSGPKNGRFEANARGWDIDLGWKYFRISLFACSCNFCQSSKTNFEKSWNSMHPNEYVHFNNHKQYNAWISKH